MPEKGEGLEKIMGISKLSAIEWGSPNKIVQVGGVARFISCKR